MDELEILIRARFSCPHTLTTLNPHSEQWLTEILSRHYSTYGLGEYQFLLSGKFEESVFFLPDALRYCSQNGEDGSGLIDSVLIFATAYALQLNEYGFRQQVEKCLEEIFFRWIETFTCEPIYKPTGEIWVSRCIVESSQRDHFLGRVIESQRKLQSTLLLERILSRWTNPSRPAWAAHFLDLAFTLCMDVATPTAVHKYGPAIKLANDQILLSGLWNMAEQTLTNSCPVEYYNAVAELCLE